MTQVWQIVIGPRQDRLSLGTRTHYATCRQ